MRYATNSTYRLELPDRIAKIQEYLYLCGKDVVVTGLLDTKTQVAIEQFKREQGLIHAAPVSEEVYLALFENVPLNREAQFRRKQVNAMLEDYQNRLRVLAFGTPDTTVTTATKPTPPKPELGEVRVWLSKQAFTIGESMEIFFEVIRPMFVRIVTINSAGKMATLFPNPYQNDNFVRPGKTYRVPPSDAPVKLTVGAPAGTDKIRVIASLNPIPADSLPLTENGEFVPDVTKRFAVAGVEFRVLPPSHNQTALNEGPQP